MPSLKELAEQYDEAVDNDPSPSDALSYVLEFTGFDYLGEHGDIDQFERDREKHGTETAIHNFVWSIASDLLKSAGSKRTTLPLCQR